MSLRDYEIGHKISCMGYPFNALIQAAIRKADSDNTLKLKEVFPEIYDELLKRYNAPGGKLPGE